MTMIAYTRSAHITREAGFKSKRFSNIKTSYQAQAPIGHIPQTGTRQTMCGKPMYEQIEVDDGIDIKICKVCQSHLRSTALKFPGCDLVLALLGNKLLPAPEY